MNKIVRSGLHLLIISAITAVFGVLTVVGVSANEGDTFDVGNLTYTVTAEGAFPTVEVESCNKNYEGTVCIPYVVTNNEISYSVTSIGNYAFHACCGLTSIIIMDSVTSIGDQAFRWCTDLKNVTIPDSVTSIGYAAFYGCSSLSEVCCGGLEPPCLGEYVFDDCPSDLKFYIPFGTKDAYVDAGWPEDNFVDIFIKSVKVVDENGKPIEGAKVMIYLKEYTPVALTGGYTNSEGIYIVYPADIPCDTVEVKKSGYQQVETKVSESDSFELVVVMKKI